MNRQQRRRLERRGITPPDSLSEWIKHGSLVVKRSEMLGVVDKLIRLHELKKKRNRWHRRAWRWWLRLFEDPGERESDDV